MKIVPLLLLQSLFAQVMSVIAQDEAPVTPPTTPAPVKEEKKEEIEEVPSQETPDEKAIRLIAKEGPAALARYLKKAQADDKAKGEKEAQEAKAKKDREAKLSEAQLKEEALNNRIAEQDKKILANDKRNLLNDNIDKLPKEFHEFVTGESVEEMQKNIDTIADRFKDQIKAIKDSSIGSNLSAAEKEKAEEKKKMLIPGFADMNFDNL